MIVLHLYPEFNVVALIRNFKNQVVMGSIYPVSNTCFKIRILTEKTKTQQEFYFIGVKQ